MKTEELIDVLVSDVQRRRWAPEPALLLAVLASVIVAGLIFAVTLGPRPEISTAMASGRFLFKFAVTITVAVSAFALVRRSLNPVTSTGMPLTVLLVGPALLGFGVVAELWGLDAAGKNSYHCVVARLILRVECQVTTEYCGHVWPVNFESGRAICESGQLNSDSTCGLWIGLG